MKYINHFVFSLITLFALALVSTPVAGQMRPNCDTDVDKPGACFLQSEEGFEFVFWCEDGLVIYPTVGNQDNDFYRLNPNGTEFLHISDRDVEVGYCTWETIFAGLCIPESPAPELLFYGFSDFQANGVTTGLGQLGCPFVMTGQGEVTRPDDGKTLQIRPVLKYVPDPDSPWGCRLQTCRILKPGE